MRRASPSAGRRHSSARCYVLWVTLLVAFRFSIQNSEASGYYGPIVYLHGGGRRINATPEFYWNLEVQRIARDYHPPEKRVAPPVALGPGGPAETLPEQLARLTAEADLADFAAALAAGAIRPPDPELATRQHASARLVIAQITDKEAPAPLPAEFDSEFADYHRGAYAYRLGPAHWEEARSAWEKLLQRPPADRKFRTVWAAFMIGKLSLAEEKPEAGTWFQRVREDARAGFGDPLGLAAESYGWEASGELQQGHAHTAAVLFLNQAALGMESAIDSLKALVPDYGLDEVPAPKRAAAEEKALHDLRTAATDPLLRRLVTIHILAGEGGEAFDETGSHGTRGARWLGAIEETHADAGDSAEYLGWVAYNNGDYQAAGRWLKLATGDSPTALWLRAKLLRRDGKLAEAAAAMLQAWKSARDPEAYAGILSEEPDDEHDSAYFSVFHSDSDTLTFSQNADADLAAIQLARGEFVQAMDLFRHGGLWIDAAYIAERILTVSELEQYVRRAPAEPSFQIDPPDTQIRSRSMRYLLGRRFVRLGRYADAQKYLPAPFNRIVTVYAKALQDGSNPKLPKAARAHAWFTAAWLARYSGMEMMGTEGPPDNFAERGDFEAVDLAAEREADTYTLTQYDRDGAHEKAIPVALRTSEEESARARRHQTLPAIRYHYRILASQHALKAAELLPDNTPELADVLNRAGLFVKSRDEPLADKYYQILERRCAKTDLGRAAIAQHWFVEIAGPWSELEKARREKLLAP